AEAIPAARSGCATALVRPLAEPRRVAPAAHLRRSAAALRPDLRPPRPRLPRRDLHHGIEPLPLHRLRPLLRRPSRNPRPQPPLPPDHHRRLLPPPRPAGEGRAPPPLIRLDEVAGSSTLNERPVYGRCLRAALKAQTEGTSHGPLCDRSGRKEIPDLHPSKRRDGAVRRAARYLILAGLLTGASAQVPSDRGDGSGSISHRGRSRLGGSRSAGGPGDVGANAGGGGTQNQDGPSGCPCTERSVLSHRFTVGAHPERGITRVEDHLRNARRAVELAHQADQQPARVAAWAGR